MKDKLYLKYGSLFIKNKISINGGFINKTSIN